MKKNQKMMVKITASYFTIFNPHVIIFLCINNLDSSREIVEGINNLSLPQNEGVDESRLICSYIDCFGENQDGPCGRCKRSFCALHNESKSKHQCGTKKFLKQIILRQGEIGETSSKLVRPIKKPKQSKLANNMETLAKRIIYIMGNEVVMTVDEIQTQSQVIHTEIQISNTRKRKSLSSQVIDLAESDYRHKKKAKKFVPSIQSQNKKISEIASDFLQHGGVRLRSGLFQVLECKDKLSHLCN